MDATLAMMLGSIGAAGVSASFALVSYRQRERMRQSGEALARLRAATGVLRLELFLETRSFARRLVQYHEHLASGRPYPLAAYPPKRGSAEAYHAGGSMIHRLLRPLTVGAIIEKQTFAADLLLEPVMVDLLRFSQASVEMLAGGELGRGFGDVDAIPGFAMTRCWDPGCDGMPGFQRVRTSYLRSAASAMTMPEPALTPLEGTKRCMTHPEFREKWEGGEVSTDFHTALEPVKLTIDGFSPAENPILWLRMVGYAHACRWFYERMRGEVTHRGIPRRAWDLARRREPVHYAKLEVPLAEMLLAVGRSGETHRYIADHAYDYEGRFEGIIDNAL